MKLPNSKLPVVNVLDLIKTQVYEIDDAYYIKAYPAIGNLYISKGNLGYITGYIRTRGRNNGKYPYNYLEMINEVFGYDRNTIEVCSNSVKDVFTVDIRPEYNPSCVDNAETLYKIESNRFDRWRCDPPYNDRTAKKMYGTPLPDVGKLLKAGARVCKPKALMFLLLGNVNRQACPLGIKRIGHVSISVIPNNENRSLHIYYKLPVEGALNYELPGVSATNLTENDTCNVSILDMNAVRPIVKGGEIKR